MRNFLERLSTDSTALWPRPASYAPTGDDVHRATVVLDQFFRFACLADVEGHDVLRLPTWYTVLRRSLTDRLAVYLPAG